MNVSARITKALVDKTVPPIEKDQIFIRDTQIKGFALRVTRSGVKSFVVEKNLGRKVRRITIGRYGPLTVELARKEAQKMLGQLATGVDLVAEKQSKRLKQVTLKEVYGDYIHARKSLKPKTLHDYHRVITVAFADWCNKPLAAITKDKVAKQHDFLGQEHGEAYANLSMRVLRAIFNFAIGQYEDAQGRSLITENPVKRLSHTRAWYRVERRQTCIKSHELAAWYQGVDALENKTLRDYLLVVLFTGLRRQEAAKLRWDEVDFQARTLTITDTKNHEPHTLPLSDYLYLLFTHRKQSISSKYVFPGSGATGHIIEPRKQMAKVIAITGVHFTVHDLRRTFITVAEGLDISAYALKRLLNHKMVNDVTSGYIVIDVERLRKPIQQISEYLLERINIRSIDVIEEIT